jgi:hypothetical protein
MEDWLRRWRAEGMINQQAEPAAAAPAMLSLLVGMLTQRALAESFDHERCTRGIAELIGRDGAP